MNPEDFAQRQLEAYNDRDLERFLAQYTEDVEVYRLPSPEPVLVGKAAFAEHYRTQRFNLPLLHAELVNRMVFGNKVIDHERVTGLGPAAQEVAAIYEINASGICKVWFLA
ncbi:MAG: nuclear transport factor 2 family protein [Wenzhouxiangella sp.]